MKRKCLLLVMLWCCSGLVWGQKNIMHQKVLDEEITSLYFDLNDVFVITFSSTTSDEVVITARSEGEYASHFVVREVRQANEMSFIGDIAFTFPNHQDKLSAHKVHAISIEIQVPSTLNVYVRSDIGNLTVTGGYQYFVADLQSGDCNLNAVSGQLKIQTVGGSINARVKKAQVIAQSKLGRIVREKVTIGPTVIDLKTLKGDINIEQSQ